MAILCTTTKKLPFVFMHRLLTKQPYAIAALDGFSKMLEHFPIYMERSAPQRAMEQDIRIDHAASLIQKIADGKYPFIPFLARA